MPTGSPLLPCFTDAHGAYRAKAQWTIETLLRPLGWSPRWLSDTGDSARGLAYVDTETALPAGWLRITRDASAAELFERRSMPDTSHVAVLDWEGHRVPLLFPPRREHATGRLLDRAGDLVAASFFWLSGWQEWAAPGVDSHGRPTHAGSFSESRDAVSMPVADIYRLWLGEALSQAGISTKSPQWKGRSWAFCPTFDVDYLRKWRPGILFRELVERPILNRPASKPQDRISRLAASVRQLITERDPFRRSMDVIFRELVSREGTGTVFFKTGGFEPYDVAIGWSKRYQQHVVSLASKLGLEIGLHPSYFSSIHRTHFSTELGRLKNITGARIRLVRQHYLRYHLGVTGLIHQDERMLADSSLGFADREGFRRGTCFPFRLFDLIGNRPLDVWEIPLLVMDSTLFSYRAFGTEEALQATRELMRFCRRVGGVCVALWHNILEDNLDFPGWSRHFVETLNEAERQNAALMSLGDVLETVS